MSSWTVVLDGIALQANQGTLPVGVDQEDVMGCLSRPPDGMGVPPLRVEDMSYAQRDGVVHFKDWYDARIITLEDVAIDADESCPECAVRADVQDVMAAWSRKCEDVELVIYTDCSGTDDDRSLVGPFGVIGRPRGAILTWHVTAGVRAATVTLRFDSIDHRLYILDALGTPGSGTQCETLTPLQPLLGTHSEVILATSSLLGYWQLDESSGTIASDSADVGALDGTYESDTLLGQAPLAPNLGLSARAGVFGTISTGTDWQSAAKTIEMWFRSTSPLDSNLWSYEDGGADQWELNTILLTLNGVDHLLSAPTTALLQDEETHHVVVTVNGTNARVWVDGVNTDTFASTVANFPVPGSSQSVFVYGWASDFAVYSDTLSGAVIGEHYDLGNQELTFDDYEVDGNVCVPFVATFTGPLTMPRVALSDGSYVGLNRSVGSGEVVTVDTNTGSAVLTYPGGSTGVTRWVVGNPFLNLPPGPLEAAGQTDNSSDTGDIEICWRPAVISG